MFLSPASSIRETDNIFVLYVCQETFFKVKVRAFLNESGADHVRLCYYIRPCVESKLSVWEWGQQMGGWTTAEKERVGHPHTVIKQCVRNRNNFHPGAKTVSYFLTTVYISLSSLVHLAGWKKARRENSCSWRKKKAQKKKKELHSKSTNPNHWLTKEGKRRKEMRSARNHQPARWQKPVSRSCFCVSVIFWQLKVKWCQKMKQMVPQSMKYTFTSRPALRKAFIW